MLHVMFVVLLYILSVLKGAWRLCLAPACGRQNPTHDSRAATATFITAESALWTNLSPNWGNTPCPAHCQRPSSLSRASGSRGARIEQLRHQPKQVIHLVHAVVGTCPCVLQPRLTPLTSTGRVPTLRVDRACALDVMNECMQWNPSEKPEQKL